MVFGVKRTRNGRKSRVTMEQWLWSTEPSHPAIVDMDTWHAAQQIGAKHSTSRDPADAPRAYRGRVFCRDCKRRMSASPFPNITPPTAPARVQPARTKSDVLACTSRRRTLRPATDGRTHLERRSTAPNDIGVKWYITGQDRSDIK
jgi:hypothetical protein